MLSCQAYITTTPRPSVLWPAGCQEKVNLPKIQKLSVTRWAWHSKHRWSLDEKPRPQLQKPKPQLPWTEFNPWGPILMRYDKHHHLGEFFYGLVTATCGAFCVFSFRGFQALWLNRHTWYHLQYILLSTTGMKPGKKWRPNMAKPINLYKSWVWTSNCWDRSQVGHWEKNS